MGSGMVAGAETAEGEPVSEQEQLAAAVEPDTEPEPEPDTEPEPEPEPETEGRCEAETTVGGTLYRCALEMPHEGEHAFQPVEAEPPEDESQPVDMTKAKQRLQAEAMRHYKRLGEIMGGDQAELIPCQLCSPDLAGWRFDRLPPPKVVEAVRAVIGLPDLSSYLPSKTEAICEDCGGKTRVKTGSLDPRFETKTCDGCGGKGYITTRPRLNPIPEDAVPPEAPNGAGTFDDDGVERDMFGTPSTDPDYGKMPNMRARPVDYWQTNRE